MHFVGIVVPAPTEADQYRGLLWLIVLAGAIIGAVSATIIDNIVKGTTAARGHNSLLLLNECLAEDQSAFVIFFVAMLAGTDFNKIWAKPALPLALFLAFLFYVMGVANTLSHDTKLGTDHVCSGSACQASVNGSCIWKILRLNIIFNALLLIFAIFFAFLATQKPGC